MTGCYKISLSRLACSEEWPSVCLRDWIARAADGVCPFHDHGLVRGRCERSEVDVRVNQSSGYGPTLVMTPVAADGMTVEASRIRSGRCEGCPRRSGYEAVVQSSLPGIAKL